VDEVVMGAAIIMERVNPKMRERGGRKGVTGIYICTNYRVGQ
jgi:hypothetical protein